MPSSSRLSDLVDRSRWHHLLTRFGITLRVIVRGFRLNCTRGERSHRKGSADYTNVCRGWSYWSIRLAVVDRQAKDLLSSHRQNELLIPPQSALIGRLQRKQERAQEEAFPDHERGIAFFFPGRSPHPTVRSRMKPWCVGRRKAPIVIHRRPQSERPGPALSQLDHTDEKNDQIRLQ
jgi:hypothetical protein